jgi:hypothetical protein
MNYRVLQPTGPWTKVGTIVTDEDIAKYPGLGGTARLVDRLEVLVPCTDTGVITGGTPSKAGISRFKPGPKPGKDAGADNAS